LLDRYALLGLFAIAAVTFPIIPLVLAKLFRPAKPNPTKQTTYECGLEFEDFPEQAQHVWVQFRVQYYLYALIFVVFDIEVIFLYPWAVAFNQSFGLTNFAASIAYFVEMFVFIGILIAALAYAWRKGLLEWA
jgi:NADH-quinone oxidoreductase subunit A